MIEKVAYKGQQSAHLSIVMQLYVQQSLGNLVEHFQSDNFSKEEGLEQVKNVFSMTTKCLDQIGRAGAFHHIIRRTAAMSDTALYELDDALEFSNLPMSGEGVFGSGLENLLKSRKEKTAEDLVPEVKRKNFKCKSESPVRSVVDNKWPHFDTAPVQGLSYQNNSKPKEWDSFHILRLPCEQRSQGQQEPRRHDKRFNGNRSYSYSNRRYGHGKPTAKWQCKYSGHVSRDNCGRLFITFFDRMGKHNFRQMGSGIDSRLQIGVHSKTTFSRNKRNTCFSLSNSFNSRRNRQSFKLKCNRKDTEKGCNERFLQYTFSGSKEKWGNASCDKLATSQQISSEETFQNGHNDKSFAVSRKRRLINNSRSIRCILPSEDFQTSSEIFPVQFSGQDVPISRPKFRSNSSTKSFHKSNFSSCSSFKKTKHTSCNIPRRLAGSKSDQENVMARSVYCSTSSFPVRFHYKQRKIKVSSQSGYNIHRGSFHVGKGSSLSNSRMSSRPESSSLAASPGSEYRIPLSSSAGKDSTLSGTDSKCQAVHETNPVASVTKLSPIRMTMTYQIPVTPSLKPHLRWWLREANILKSQSVQPTQFTETMTTDASLYGWGGRMKSQTVQGHWSNLQKLYHINCLEMEAVYLTMKHFLPNLSNKNVLIQTDNTTVAQYLNCQGGTKSLDLCHLTLKLWSLALENNICLKAVYIAGKKNVLVDYLSRQSIKQTEWSLNKTVPDRIFCHWGHPLMDLFVTFQNKQTQLFCSWMIQQQASAIDAMSISWQNMFAYAFPPMQMIPRVLQHMKQYYSKIILIAPNWPRQ